MCHGHIDPKMLMREAEDRFRAAQPAPSQARDKDAPVQVPPEFIGGLRGVWARITALAAPLRARSQ